LVAGGQMIQGELTWERLLTVLMRWAARLGLGRGGSNARRHARVARTASQGTSLWVQLAGGEAAGLMELSLASAVPSGFELKSWKPSGGERGGA
jgi:hypothetical protein